MTDERKTRFSWRALASVLIGVAFLVMGVSGTILFISPPGRGANWSDWRMIGYSKHEWADLHIAFGVMFVLAAILHLILNIRPLISYFRNRMTRHIGLRREWIAALLLSGLVFLGTRYDVPPVSSLLNFGESVKRGWEEPTVAAPIPHAELLSLKELAEKAGVTLEQATERLTKQEMKGITGDIVVAELATQNNTTPQRVYQIVQDLPARGAGRHGGTEEGGGKGSGKGGDGEHRGAGGGMGGGMGGGWGGGGGGGGGPGGGAGRMTLTEFCQSRGIDPAEALARLEAAGMKAAEGKTVRDIASDNGLSRPFKIIEIIEGRASK
jgi:hypothetical protein